MLQQKGPINQTQQPTTKTRDEQKFVPLSVTTNLLSQNNSGEEGSATLTSTENGKTKVVFKLSGAPKDIAQPAHIHMGSCADLGDVLYPLTSPVNGESETILDANLSDILNKLPLAINVHKSADEINVYYACGDIKISSGALTSPSPSGQNLLSPSVSPKASPDDRNRDGGQFQTPTDRRRGADKPED